MNPFYFGRSERRLFGVYHPPSGESVRDTAAVVCPPAFAEYLRCHRALRQLAILLSQRGFPTLRFDYYATGDSYGDDTAATFEQWQEDVEVAIDEVLALGSRARAAVIGLRLGATLGCTVGSRHPAVTEAALWDPVVSGAGYLRELASHYPAGFVAAQDAPTEVLGFPLPRALAAGIGDLDLARLDLSSLRRVLLVHNAQDPRFESFAAGFSSASTEVTRLHLPAAAIWSLDSVNPTELVPMATLKPIVAFIDGAERTP